MPALSPLVSAIINSVVSAIIDAPPTVPTVPVYSAMARAFPMDAKKGELTPPIEQSVLISGQAYNAAPGLQVRNEQNMIMMPIMLQQTVPVRYQMDLMGNVWRIWILSAAENAAPDPQK